MDLFKDYINGLDEFQKPILVVNNEIKPKAKNLNVSISKPKGDIEMKNISYRPKEHRYIGRKSILHKRLVVYAKTQAECLLKLNAKIKEEKRALKEREQRQIRLTVANYWQNWYKETKEPFIADGTKEDLKNVFKKLEPLYDVKLANLTKEKVLFFLKTLPDNRAKEKVIVNFRAMLDFAVKERKIKFNPFDTIVIKMKKRKPKPPFTYDEQKRILEYIKDREYEPIIMFYLLTGLRRRELPFKDIEQHIDNNNIFTAINLKGRNKEERFKKIKITDGLKQIVFDNLDTFHSYNEEKIFQRFKDCLKALNIKGSLHTCRHTFATNCFYLNKPDLIIAKEMGHSTTQITRDTYIDVDYNLSCEKVRELYHNLYNEI